MEKERQEKSEKRKKPKRCQAQNKRRKMDNSAGGIRKEDQSDEVKTFLKSATVVPVSRGKSKQLKIVPLAGLGWEARTLLYQMADSVVNIAEHRWELSTLLPTRALDSLDWE